MFNSPQVSISKVSTRLYEYSGIARLVSRLTAIGKRDSVFIWIPKNAGSSFYEIYRRLGSAVKCKSLHSAKYRFAQRGHVTFGHMDYAQLVRAGHVSEEFDRSAFKFCFSRDPFARAVSLYFYLFGDRPQLSFLDFSRKLVEDGVRPIGLINRKDNSQCNPQVRWIEDLKIDFIGAIENFAADVAQVMAAIDLPYLQPASLNTTAHSAHVDYYCDESRDIIAAVYREDFEYFGYRKELTVSAVQNRLGS